MRFTSLLRSLVLLGLTSLMLGFSRAGTVQFEYLSVQIPSGGKDSVFTSEGPIFKTVTDQKSFEALLGKNPDIKVDWGLESVLIVNGGKLAKPTFFTRVRTVYLLEPYQQKAENTNIKLKVGYYQGDGSEDRVSPLPPIRGKVVVLKLKLPAAQLKKISPKEVELYVETPPVYKIGPVKPKSLIQP